MKSFAFSSILICLLSISCSTQKQLAKHAIEISLTKGSCYGKCPTYHFDIVGDSLLYYGRANTARLGSYKAAKGKKYAERIYSKAMELGFFKMNEKYPIDGHLISDLPKITLYIRHGESAKKVEFTHDAPIELLELINYIDLTRENLHWSSASNEYWQKKFFNSNNKQQ